MNVPVTFKWTFIGVLGLTALSFIGLGLLAFFGNTSVAVDHIPIAQKNLSTACDFGWKAGLGAILGLLGGKAT